MFNVGDVVRLKSGGPSMTVENVIGSGGNPSDEVRKKRGWSDGDVDCTWFNGNEKKYDIFRQATVEKI